jgi:hypothetical protein
LYKDEITYYKKQCIDDFQNVKNLYVQRIEPIFANADAEAEELANKTFKEIGNRPAYNDNADMSDYAENAIEEGYKAFELLSLMHYRTLANWIIAAASIWEQQLYLFLTKAGLSTKNEYTAIKEKYLKELNLDIDNYTLLVNFRDLANVLKHGEGNAEKKLKKAQPKYFKNTNLLGNTNLLSINKSSLLEKTLNIHTKDLLEFCDTIINFWETA